MSFSRDRPLHHIASSVFQAASPESSFYSSLYLGDFQSVVCGYLAPEALGASPDLWGWHCWGEGGSPSSLPAGQALLGMPWHTGVPDACLASATATEPSADSAARPKPVLLGGLDAHRLHVPAKHQGPLQLSLLIWKSAVSNNSQRLSSVPGVATHACHLLAPHPWDVGGVSQVTFR